MAEPTQVRPSTPPPAAPAAPPTQGPPQGPPPQVAPPQAAPPIAAPPGYGHVPSGGPYDGAYGNPFSGYQHPAPPKKGRLWLWITLAVVLVLAAGTGVTLAVLKPWDDSSTASKGKDPDGDPDTGKDEKAIQGDVTGDDFGDALYYLYYDYDNVKKVTATSNGNGFETNEVAVDPYTEPNELYFDWDGDGVNEKLAWKFVSSGKQITLSSNDSDFPGEQTHTASLSSLKEYGDIQVRVVNGDFDGDGDQDLALAGPNDKVVDVSVLVNDGKGSFAAPVLWVSIPNAVIDVTRITPGDFDKDGDADLWAELPAERLDDEAYTKYYSGDRGYALLTSSGNNFEVGAVNKSSTYAEAFLVGDVVGDGTTNIVGVNTTYDEKLTVNVYDVSSGQLKEVAGFTGTTNVGNRSLQGASLSDVDGDGKADVVFAVKAYKETKFTGIQVMTSTGAVFEEALVWADTPPCTDDSCRIEFLPSRRN